MVFGEQWGLGLLVKHSYRERLPWRQNNVFAQGSNQDLLELALLREALECSMVSAVEAHTSPV